MPVGWDQLVEPPRLRHEEGRRATWLELFFDLIFVVGITEVGAWLHQPLDVRTVVLFLLFYGSIYWAWVGHTLYANRFDTDDVPYRLVTFAMMMAAFGMAVPLTHMTIPGEALFAGGYVAIRALLLMLYLRAWFHLPDARPMTGLYLKGISAGALLWLVSLAVPAPGRYLLWIAGLAVDVVTPWIGRGVLRQFPLHAEHFPERLALLTLIVLGEAVIAVEQGLSHVPIAGAWVTAAVLAFVVSVCVWWLYFTFVNYAKLDHALTHGLPYLYLHLPITAGISAMAVAMGRLVEEAARHELHHDTLVLLGMSTTIWLAAFFRLMWTTDRRHLRRNLLAAFSFAVIATAALTVFGQHLPPLGVMGILTALFVTLVVLDTEYGLPAVALDETAGAEAGVMSDGQK